MDQRFIVYAKTNRETGDIVQLALMDNETLEVIYIPDINGVPDFVVERLALLKLTDVNKQTKGEIVGRKLHDDMLIVYLTYDEYKQIKEECK